MDNVKDKNIKRLKSLLSSWSISWCHGTHLRTAARIETQEGTWLAANRLAKLWACIIKARCFFFYSKLRTELNGKTSSPNWRRYIKNCGAHTHVRTHARTHARAHTHIHERAHKHTRTHAYARARTHTHTHARTHTHTRARTHTLTHVHAHAHTHLP